MKRVLFAMLSALGMFVTAAPVANAQVVVPMASNGAVRLSWGWRGGTCNVRYTEASEVVYKYATSAGCDEGGVTISGLAPGQKYKFQVSPDNVNWSKVVATTAKSWTGTMVAGEVVNGDGAVRLVWNQRGGTCYIRYTEANQKVYKYWTQTSCDDGQDVIGALVPGRKYRFQISQDLMGWSRPIVARATGGMVVAPVVSSVATAPVVMTTASVAPVMATTATVATVNGNGAVRVNWAYRGGTCNVRYTEANQQMYKYMTSAGCDEGGVTIGSLVEGRKYKFQVAQNNWSSWTRAVRAVAR